MRIESALTYKIMSSMSLLDLAKIVVDEHYTPEDRLKAANGIKTRELNGAAWLALSLEDKATVRKAFEYDTTGEGLRSA